MLMNEGRSLLFRSGVKETGKLGTGTNSDLTYCKYSPEFCGFGKWILFIYLVYSCLVTY